MPELPEVEAVCRKLRRDALGARIAALHVLRRPNRLLEKSAAGRTILGVDRRAKNVLLVLDRDLVIRVHLRMTGNLYVVPDWRLRPATTRAYFELADGRGLVFDDPRALGVLEPMTPAEAERLCSALGAEPLSCTFTLELLLAMARRSRAPSKLFLMDQKRVAGLGNIYAAEALHRARIHPARPMNRLSRTRIRTLYAAIVGVLGDAVESACNAYSGPGEFEAGEAMLLAVYGREGQKCLRCGRGIRRIPQGGRSTYFCPGCQR